MSPAATLLTVAALHWAAMASPGPNVLLVARTAMAQSRRAALAAAVGVAAGAVLLATAAAVGLGVLVQQAGWLRTALSLAGAGYLVYLGVTTWRSAEDPLPTVEAVEARGDFRRGLLTNLSNPKAAVFYGSILAPTLDIGVSGWVGVAAIVLIAVDALVWHCGLAVVFARPGVQRSYLRAKPLIDRVVGAALGLIGARLGLSALRPG